MKCLYLIFLKNPEFGFFGGSFPLLETFLVYTGKGGNVMKCQLNAGRDTDFGGWRPKKEAEHRVTRRAQRRRSERSLFAFQLFHCGRCAFHRDPCLPSVRRA